MRFDVVLGHGGGAYPMQALSARLGLNRMLGHGHQPAPWIHLADSVDLFRFAMAHQYLQGPVNAVAPDAVTQATFAQALAASFGRRAWLRMPGLPLRALVRGNVHSAAGGTELRSECCDGAWLPVRAPAAEWCAGRPCAG